MKQIKDERNKIMRHSANQQNMRQKDETNDNKRQINKQEIKEIEIEV